MYDSITNRLYDNVALTSNSSGDCGHRRFHPLRPAWSTTVAGCLTGDSETVLLRMSQPTDEAAGQRAGGVRQPGPLERWRRCEDLGNGRAEDARGRYAACGNATAGKGITRVVPRLAGGRT